VQPAPPAAVEYRNIDLTRKSEFYANTIYTMILCLKKLIIFLLDQLQHNKISFSPAGLVAQKNQTFGRNRACGYSKNNRHNHS
jgi:hypothetical protein